MLHIPHHTFSGPLGPLTLNYIIIIYIKETNGWEPSQVKEAKKTKKTTLRLDPLEILNQKTAWKKMMLENRAGFTVSHYIHYVNFLKMQLVYYQQLNPIDYKMGYYKQVIANSSHLPPLCGLFGRYMSKKHAILRGFIPLEKTA